LLGGTLKQALSADYGQLKVLFAIQRMLLLVASTRAGMVGASTFISLSFAEELAELSNYRVAALPLPLPAPANGWTLDKDTADCTTFYLTDMWQNIMLRWTPLCKPLKNAD
jgi:hypothetical protein